MRDVRWQTWSGTGLEHLALVAGADRGAVADAVLVGVEPGFGASYRIELDGNWRVRRLTVAVAGGGRLELLADGGGGWSQPDGTERPDLGGAYDVDLSATPFTNTLPIRRLGLGVGATADIEVVHVLLPSLSVARRRQRYTRLAEGRYRFESNGGAFTCDIEVDDDGLVVTYPGLFRRVPA